MAIRLMVFDFDIEYVKGNSIPRVDALSRLRFYKESKDKTEEEFEDTFSHWVETLFFDRKAAETRHNPVLSRITSRIKNTYREIVPRWNKEIRHKLTIEHGVICNREPIIPPRNTKKTCDKKYT